MQNNVYENELPLRNRKNKNGFLDVLWIVALIICICLTAFRQWWAKNIAGVIVDGVSMKQTLNDGDSLLMRYVTEDYQPKRGDVIVVNVSGYEECKDVESGYIIKRLIAIEGDKVRCTQGKLEIKYAGSDSWTTLDETSYAYYENDVKLDFEEYPVGENEIFFLGDNRRNSKDSRFKEGLSHLNGLYKEQDIYGIVPQWSIDNKEIIKHIFFKK